MVTTIPKMLPATNRVQRGHDRVATLGMAVLLFGFTSNALFEVAVRSPGLPTVALAALLLVAFVALQIGVISHPVRRGRRRLLYAALFGQVLLTLVPAPMFGVNWFGIGGFVLGGLWLAWPDRRGLVAAFVGDLALALMTHLAGSGAATVGYALFVHPAVGLLVVVGPALLRTIATSLDQTQQAVADATTARYRADVLARLQDNVFEQIRALRALVATALVTPVREAAVVELSDASRQALARVRQTSHDAPATPSPPITVDDPITDPVRIRRLALTLLVLSVAMQVLLTIPLYFEDGPIFLVVLVAGLVGSLVLVTLPRRGLTWLALGTLAMAAAIPAVLHPASLFNRYTLFITVVDRAVTVWALRELYVQTNERERVRDRLAQLAATAERSRISRDLHDLLGYGLSAISLKADLARRLLATDTRRAAHELREVEVLVEHCNQDVELLSQPDPILDLRDEIASVTSVSSALGIKVEVQLTPDPLPLCPSSTMVAMVLREAVTNVLRHAKASWMRILITHDQQEWAIEVTNDGVAPNPADAGRGLTNMQVRLATVGGCVSAHPDGRGRFQLRATVPTT